MYGYSLPDQNRERNVVIYARVSTEHEAQLSALENQKEWYRQILEYHPEWHLVRMYVDEGITGTSAHKRPQFMQMIKDADKKEFDLILTREVSRFARNTVDTLQYTRKLKSKGVEVFFINDNIKTFDGDGELRLTIMATLAQDESRKTSIRVKSGQQTSMENGVFYGNGNILGYDRVGKSMVINPEQARTVRMIFDWYTDGWGLRKIQFELERLGVKTSQGKSKWYVTTISHILKNSFYCGIITYHKEYTPDFLEQKKIKNYGEMEFVKTRGTHQPIISEEEFNQAQEIMNSRKKNLTNSNSGRRSVGVKPYGDVWCKLLECSCGHRFNRKMWHKKDDEIQYGYQCYHSLRTGTVKTRQKKGLPIDGICETPMVAGWKLQMMAKYIFNEYLSNVDEVLALANSILEKHIQDKEEIENCDNSEIIQQKQDEIEKLEKRYKRLLIMRSDEEIDKETFLSMKKDIEERTSTLQEEVNRLSPTEVYPSVVEDSVDYKEKLSMLKYALEQYTDFSRDEDIPEDVIDAFVRKIIVSKDGFDWYLRFSYNKAPRKCTVEGTKKHHKIVDLDKTPNSVSCTTGCNQRKAELIGFIQVYEYLFESNYAKQYLYNDSKKRRLLQWNDFYIRIFV